MDEKELKNKHNHNHSPESKKRQLNRLSRIIGHLEHIKTMIENDDDCSDIIIQLSAAKSATTSLGKYIINEHVEHCIYHALEDGDTDAIDEFKEAILKFY